MYLKTIVDRIYKKFKYTYKVFRSYGTSGSLEKGETRLDIPAAAVYSHNLSRSIHLHPDFAVCLASDSVYYSNSTKYLPLVWLKRMHAMHLAVSSLG